MCNPEAEYVYVLQIKDILLPVPLSYMKSYIGSCCTNVLDGYTIHVCACA